MALSSWFCTRSTRNMLVKIVHPNGHAELHDRPILAAEIMLRNLRCCVTHPHIFQQPWAIVAPDTMLMLGQKFYVVPISTIRKLQRNSLKRSPSPTQEDSTGQNSRDEEEGIGNTPKQPCTCLNQSEGRGYKPVTEEKDKDGCLSDENKCFMCFLTGTKHNTTGKDTSDSGRSMSAVGSSETEELNKKITRGHARKGRKRSPRRNSSFDHWQPSLDIITEEHA